MPVIDKWRGRKVFAASLALTAALVSTTTALAEVSWAVIDTRTGQVLGHESGEKRRPPASLAKMMTVYMTFEAIKKGKLNWDDQIFVSRNASEKIPTKLWLKADETVSVFDAVNGMIIISANDAATAIAEHLAGSEAEFGRMMTKRAQELGLKDTLFSNPSGLTDGVLQLTTARDMATLGLALERDFPTEFNLFSQPSFVFRGKKLKGHNNLMYRYGVIDGIKTGYTTAAGFNLVSSLRLGDRHLVGAVLGGESARSRDEKMEALLKQFSTHGDGTASPMVALNTQPQKRKQEVATGEPIDESLIEQGDGGFLVAASPSTWRIQVGALPTEAGAQGLLDRAGRFVRAIHTDAAGNVEPTNRNGATLYRVRFDGFEDKRAAGRACSVLKQQKFDCMIVKLD